MSVFRSYLFLFVYLGVLHVVLRWVLSNTPTWFAFVVLVASVAGLVHMLYSIRAERRAERIPQHR